MLFANVYMFLDPLPFRFLSVLSFELMICEKNSIKIELHTIDMQNI